jgi:ribosomal protein L37AE/L43A
MAMNRMQFQQGLSMAEFQGRYGSEDQCERAMIESRWPQGFVCRACSGVSSRSFRREGLQYWECLGCGHQCSLISGTIFEATKLGLIHWFLAMHLLTQAKNGVSALELKRHLGVCYKTALLLKHKLMEVMRLREEPRQLTGRVEMDDAYLGGERLGGKPGGGSENKVPFIAAVQTTESGQPVLCCLTQAPFTTAAVLDFAAKSLARPTTVVSDGLGCFAVLASLGMVHQRTITGGGSASAKMPQFAAVNTLPGNLKTTIKDTYHSFDFAKYAHRYLGAVQYLFNRRFNLRTILPRLLVASVTTPPRPGRILRHGLVRAEVCR